MLNNMEHIFVIGHNTIFSFQFFNFNFSEMGK